MVRCIFTTIMMIFALLLPSLCMGREVLVDAATCRALMAHQPNSDVAYKGGVDVRGKPVKSADLDPESQLDQGSLLGQDISFPLTLDVAKEYGGAAPNNGAVSGGNPSFQNHPSFKSHPGLEGKINLGQIVIKDGQVTLDGKPLGRQDQEKLYYQCQQRKMLP